MTTEQLDQAVANLRSLREAYDEAKAASTEAHGKYEEAEKDLMNLLKAAGKTKYEAEGVGLVYITTKEVYATPKSIGQKRALFDWIKGTHGPDVLSSMLSINHQTLNSFCNKEREANPTTVIPGLDMPTMTENLSLRKK